MKNPSTQALDLAQEREALELFRVLVEQSTEQQNQALASAAVQQPGIAERVRSMLAHALSTQNSAFAITTDAPVSSTSSLSTPAQFGPFRVLGLLGEGGMARVVRAVRALPQGEQQVAIKFVYSPSANAVHHDSSQLLRERFLRERELLTRLQHPAIAPLVDFGETEDYLWYAMTLIEGETIAQFVQRTQARKERCVELILVLCDALRYAHSLGVIHRDIKPSNVLVSKDGKLHLIDFGIAKAIDETTDLTTFGQTPMTPGYAAPEQRAQGMVSTATDQWQVAALAVQLLSGKRYQPSESASSASVKTLLPAELPHAQDLAAVLAQALRPEAKERYPSMASFAQDLRAAASGLPVQARAGERGYELRKLLSRYRWAVAAAAIVPTTLFLASVYSYGAWQAAQAQAQIAERANQLLSQVFLSDEHGPILMQLSLPDLIQNGIELTIAEQQLPASSRIKLLSEFSERAAELEQPEPAIKAAREALRLARSDPTTDSIAERNVAAQLAFALISAPERARYEAEIQSLLQHALDFGKIESIEQADLAVTVWRGRAFDAAYRQEFEPALKHIEQAQSIATQWLASDPWAQLLALRGKAEILAGIGRDEESAQSFQSLITQAEAHLKTHPKLQNTLQWDRARLCSQYSLFDAAKGVEQCQKNLALLKASNQAETILGFENLSALGRCFNNLGKPEEAFAQYQRAEAILLKLEGPASQSLRMATIRRRIGARLIDLQRPQEAIAPLSSALSILRLALEPGHVHTQEVQTELAQAFFHMGQHNQAKREFVQVNEAAELSAGTRKRYDELAKALR